MKLVFTIEVDGQPWKSATCDLDKGEVPGAVAGGLINEYHRANWGNQVSGDNEKTKSWMLRVRSEWE